MQLIDDRNPCRNAAKVTAGIQKQRGWGGCEGADGSELGLGRAWLTGELFSRRKEKTVWGEKMERNVSQVERRECDKRISPCLQPVQWMQKTNLGGTLRKSKLFLRDCFKGFLDVASIYLFLPFFPRKRKDPL